MKYSFALSIITLVGLSSLSSALPSSLSSVLPSYLIVDERLSPPFPFPPYKKRDGISDVQMLNFALTLEHLENAFYSQGLAKYSMQDFVKAGLPDWAYGRFREIAQHEKTHVEFLRTAITTAKAEAVEPCEYHFPDTDPNSFVDIASSLENVGTSAYGGAVAFIQTKAYATVAGSILGVEARHSAWIDSAVRKFNPWNTAFETPLDLNHAFTIASGFIKSCPTSNPTLPVKAFATLTIEEHSPDGYVKLSFDEPEDCPPLFAAFLVGTGTQFAPISPKGQVKVPEGLMGLVYVIITKDGGKVTDETTVAGPAIMKLPFSADIHLD